MAPFNSSTLDGDKKAVFQGKTLRYPVPIELFPDQIGPYPYGSLEKGYMNLMNEKTLPENIHPRSQEILLDLEKRYDTALDLQMNLHTEDLETGKRRFISRSEEYDGPAGRSEGVQRRLTSLARTICILESEFRTYKNEQASQLKILQLDTELLRAIDEANRNRLVINMGDYLAALSNDFRSNQKFQDFKDRYSWYFMGKTKISEIIDEYDEEQKQIGNFGDMIESPMTRSLQKAFQFLRPAYDSLDDIIWFLRAYAERTSTVHPINDMFLEGEYIKLRDAITRDYNSFPFLGSIAQTHELQYEVRRTLDLVIQRFYSSWSFQPGGYCEQSVAMKQLRQAYVRKMRKENPMFGRKERFSDGDENLEEGMAALSTQEEASLAKGDRTREKSRTEDEAIAVLEMNESEYKRALAECRGQIIGVSKNDHVARVLLGMHKELADLRIAKEHSEKNASDYCRKWMRAQEDSKKNKVEGKKRLEKQAEDFKAQIEELKAKQ